MLTYETLEKRWQERPYHHLRQSRPTIGEDGLLIGADCVLCKRSENGGLAVDGSEARILAMLSLAYGRLVPIVLLDHIRNASKALAKGEEVIAGIHLSFAALPPIENALRVLKLLFQAEQLLDDGLDPGDLLAGLDRLPEGTTAADWRAFLKTYEDQSRDRNGRWTTGNAGAIQVADNRPFGTISDAQAPDRADAVTITRGPDGSTIVSNYQSVTAIAGKGEYRGECVSLVRELGNLPPTWEWRAGAAIKGPGDPPLAEGTIIATMDENGRYPQNKRDKHAAVFMGYVSDEKGIIGMKIYDQYRIGRHREGIKSPGYRTINFDNNKNKQNNAYSYSVVTTK